MNQTLRYVVDAPSGLARSPSSTLRILTSYRYIDSQRLLYPPFSIVETYPEPRFLVDVEKAHDPLKRLAEEAMAEHRAMKATRP